MNDRDRADFKDRILARLADLEQDLARGKDGEAVVTLDQQSVGRLSRMDALQYQAMSKAQQQRRQAEVTRLRLALHRVDEDEYGYCEDCGEAIAPGRLDLDLAATRCVSCASG